MEEISKLIQTELNLTPKLKELHTQVMNLIKRGADSVKEIHTLVADIEFDDDSWYDSAINPKCINLMFRQWIILLYGDPNIEFISVQSNTFVRQYRTLIKTIVVNKIYDTIKHNDIDEYSNLLETYHNMLELTRFYEEGSASVTIMDRICQEFKGADIESYIDFFLKLLIYIMKGNNSTTRTQLCIIFGMMIRISKYSFINHAIQLLDRYGFTFDTFNVLSNPLAPNQVSETEVYDIIGEEDFPDLLNLIQVSDHPVLKKILFICCLHLNYNSDVKQMTQVLCDAYEMFDSEQQTIFVNLAIRRASYELFHIMADARPVSLNSENLQILISPVYNKYVESARQRMIELLLKQGYDISGLVREKLPVDSYKKFLHDQDIDLFRYQS